MPCGQRPRNWPRLACSVGFVARRELRRRSFQYLIPPDGHVGDGISLRFAQLQMSSQLLIPGQLIHRYSRMFYWSQRSEEHTSELQSRGHLVCRLLLEKKKDKTSYKVST